MEGSVAEALLDAARSGETETASRLLNANADPNSHEYVVGATPLETAALEGHEERASAAQSRRRPERL